MSSLVVKTRVAIGSADLDALVPAERAEAERLGLGEHRRAEWRAGRLAAHGALVLLLGDAGAAGLCIVRADDGAPQVEGADVALSLSHGKKFAVAAAGRVARLGIDLCEIARAPNVERIAGRFLHADERSLPRTPADWALLWALKEAAAKALRRGLFDGGLAGSRVVSLSPTGGSFAFPDFVVETEIGEEDVTAIVYA
jgi:4'-phosphopantetheinyl transferase EntD